MRPSNSDQTLYWLKHVCPPLPWWEGSGTQNNRHVVWAIGHSATTINIIRKGKGGAFNRRTPFRTYSQFLTIMEELFVAAGLAVHLVAKFQELNTNGHPQEEDVTVATYEPDMLIPSETLRHAVWPHLVPPR